MVGCEQLPASAARSEVLNAVVRLLVDSLAPGPWWELTVHYPALARPLVLSRPSAVAAALTRTLLAPGTPSHTQDATGRLLAVVLAASPASHAALPSEQQLSLLQWCLRGTGPDRGEPAWQATVAAELLASGNQALPPAFAEFLASGAEMNPALVPALLAYLRAARGPDRCVACHG